MPTPINLMGTPLSYRPQPRAAQKRRNGKGQEECQGLAAGCAGAVGEAGQQQQQQQDSSRAGHVQPQGTVMKKRRKSKRKKRCSSSRSRKSSMSASTARRS